MRGGIAKIIPSVKLTLMLPADVILKMNLHLFSPAQARVPKGAYQVFLSQLINDYFSKVNDNATSDRGTDPNGSRVAPQDGG